MKNNKISLRNKMIYQVFVRQFSSTHDFNGVIRQLDRIKDLGTDILYLLPFYPIGKKDRKGSVGSPYSIYDYRAIDPLNGTLEDFKNLIEQTHQKGMKIIIDMVLNHTSRDSVLLQQHKDWFYLKNGEIGNKVGDWSDICDLDYSNDKLVEEIIDMLKYWVSLGVDGFRMDVCSMVPASFWKKAIEELHKINEDIIMLGESIELDFIRHLRNNGFYAMSDGEAFEYFDMLYCYDIRESQDDFYYNNKNLNVWLKDILNQESRYKTDYVKIRYLDNHDRERVANFKSGSNLMNLWALNFYLKGASFVYAGDEVCDPHLPSLFEIDEVNWDFSKDISNFIKTLAYIKKKEIYSKGNFNVIFQDNNVAYLSYDLNNQKSIGIFNFENYQVEINVNLKDGIYKNEINNEEIAVINGKIVIKDKPIIIELL